MRVKTNFKVRLGISMFFVVLGTVTIVKGKIIYVDDSAVGVNNGTSWANAYNYLQDALADANTAEKPVEIRVAQGVYTPDKGNGITPGDKMASFQLINGVTIFGGFAGDVTSEPDTRFIEAFKTILSGDLAGDDAEVDDPNGFYNDPTRAENSSFVVGGDDVDESAILDGVTITAGDAGIRNWFSSPSVANCTFTNARRGILNLSFGQELNQRITGCIFKGHLSGGIDQSGGSLTLIDCTFTGNTGRAIQGFSGIDLTLHNCTFIDNDSRGIAIIDCAFRENLRMYDCVFKNNISPGLAIVWADVDQGFILENCIFSGNVGDLIRTRGEKVAISNCIFTGSIGDVIEHNEGRLVVNNCVFAGNRGENRSGGIYSRSRYTTVQNCTFSDITSESDGSALNLLYGGKISNCIFWNNNIPAIKNRYGEIIISYSNFEGGWPGEGNIDVDPYFVSPGYWELNSTPEDVNDDFWIEGDYHLQSQAGHWDQQSQIWVQDDVTSLCIDAGDPDSPIGTEPFPNGGRINMGAYGACDKASKSYFGKPVSDVIMAGDINGDGIVDDEDLAILNSHWMMRAEDLVNKPPTVRLVEPQDGDRIAWRGPATFIADANDPDGQVDKVMFYAKYEKSDGTRTRGYEDNDGSDGWEIEFTWPEESYFGEWVTWAEATDNDGQVGFSPEIKITLYRP